MTKARLHFLLLNIGHFLDHLVMLVFATVAALVLVTDWNMSYGELIAYATPGFIAFGLFSLPAGWLADRWSREGMMSVYFFGVGLASIVCAFASTPIEMAAGLFIVGMFAAIYHPVGLTLVVEGARRTGMALAANGVWGNLGVGAAALLTGLFIDHGGWRSAFVWPGIASLALGLAYTWLMWPEISGSTKRTKNGRAMDDVASSSHASPFSLPDRQLYLRVTAIILFTTAISALIFQSTTFALPKIFEERLTGVAGSASLIGWATFIVAIVASMAQFVVGHYLDSLGPRIMFLSVAGLQAACFALMPGLTDWAALAVALAFMVGAFGQLPINDYMIGRMARPETRASIYGARFVLTFTVLALSLPLIAWIHSNWGFDVLFRLLAGVAVLVFLAAALLPGRLPEPTAPAPAEA